MTATQNAIEEMRVEGHSTQATIDALCDGEALATLGLGDDDQSDIEDAIDDLRASSAAAATLGCQGKWIDV